MDKTELKQIIKLEKNLTLGNTSIGHQMKVILTRHPAWIRYKYVKYMRLADCSKSLLRMLYDYKRNVLGLKLGYEINARNIGGGLTLYHNGPIVINGKSIIGKNLKLHGDNCIGNDGTTDACPVIGDNVELGVGSKIIGGVNIADNVVIGAGAVVVSDVSVEGAIVVGVPGKIIKVQEAQRKL